MFVCVRARNRAVGAATRLATPIFSGVGARTIVTPTPDLFSRVLGVFERGLCPRQLKIRARACP